MPNQSVIVLDFGGQYNQLIARRVRECNVYCEVKPNTMTVEEIRAFDPIGIIFTGGPQSVYAEGSPQVDPEIFRLGIPILGICYGCQLMAQYLGGEVTAAGKDTAREYGKTETWFDTDCRLFRGLPEQSITWMSHGDYMEKVPEGFALVAHSDACPNVAICDEGRGFYGVQYHPEVNHTEHGTDMIRNFLATDTHEALGYFSLRTVLLYLFVTIPPILLLLKTERRDRLWVPALCCVAALLAGAGTVFLGMQGFSSAMRNDKSLRYQIAPVNIVYSTATTLLTDKNPDAEVKRVVVDERPSLGVVPDGKSLLVVVIGETTRTANWQPAGYAKETAPRLTADKEVLQFPRVLACGTSTDVSLPCMLSRVGRRDYDRDRIVSEESLPALLQRAGLSVSWIENQSGCKGTCAGVPTRKPAVDEALCPGGVCFDTVFADEIHREIENLAPGRPAVVFLHMMGSHGPAYWSRSPESDKAFRPECQEADLGSCTKEEIAAAYDNSVRHTDRALADVIEELRKAAQAGVATGLVYVSDHGESLGENGLFLHGAPYWMAPAEQIEVPGILWLSDNYRRAFGIDYEKIVEKARGDVRHDHLYHTVLGLLKVRSTAYDKTWDLAS